MNHWTRVAAPPGWQVLRIAEGPEGFSTQAAPVLYWLVDDEDGCIFAVPPGGEDCRVHVDNDSGARYATPQPEDISEAVAVRDSAGQVWLTTDGVTVATTVEAIPEHIARWNNWLRRLR